jgi:hypothetical protein
VSSVRGLDDHVQPLDEISNCEQIQFALNGRLWKSRDLSTVAVEHARTEDGLQRARTIRATRMKVFEAIYRTSHHARRVCLRSGESLRIELHKYQV